MEAHKPKQYFTLDYSEDYESLVESSDELSFSFDDFKEKLFLSHIYTSDEYKYLTSNFSKIQKSDKQRYYAIAVDSIKSAKTSIACIKNLEYLDEHPAFKNIVQKLNDLQADLVTINLFSETYRIAIKKLLSYIDPEFVFKPQSIVNYLSIFVCGQLEAKRALAVTVYKHLVRIGLIGNSTEAEWMPTAKSTPLFIGHTGSGKSLLIKTISGILPVPVAIVNINTITQTGYHGQDFDSCITSLLVEAEGFLKDDDDGNRMDSKIENYVEKGIIFIDEFCKVAYRINRNDTVGTLGVQKEILHHIDGKIVEAKSSFDYYAPRVKVNTRNITYCFAGAFTGIEQIVSSRLNIGLGFRSSSSDKAIDSDVLHSDIESYGIIKELAGRISEIAQLEPLKKNQLYEILKKTKGNALEKEINTLKLSGVSVELEDTALEYITEKAIENYGARFLEVLTGKLFRSIYLNIDDYKNKTIAIDYQQCKDVLG